jgi:chromate transporter
MSASSPNPPPTVAAIFAGFFSVGIIGFGGVLPLARRMIVEQRRWMSGPEFTDLLALSQFLPGGNVINLSAAVGLRFRGLPGALAGLAGLMCAPLLVVIALGLFYARFEGQPAVRHAFVGLAAAAAGLIIAMSVKIALPLRRDLAGIALAAVTFAAIALLRTPLLPTMAVTASAGFLIAWKRQR